MSGKVALFTGSDTGVGYETALAVAGRNASIIIANHNAARGKAAVSNITRLTGNSRVESLVLDLSSFASVRQVVAEVLAKHTVLDLVIMDAGVSTPHGVTKDGFEYVVQVNYLGHFLLEQLVLPALRASQAGKLIHVSSGASYLACYGHAPDCTSLDKIAAIVKANTTVSNYGLTKFMQVYNARELALREKARGSKVRAYAIRPGLVDTPLVERTMPPTQEKYLCSVPQCVNGWRGHKCDTCPMPASAGANSPTYVAVTDLPVEQDGDFYFMCKVTKPPAWTDVEANQAKLYDMSLHWTGTSPSVAVEFV